MATYAYLQHTHANSGANGSTSAAVDMTGVDLICGGVIHDTSADNVAPTDSLGNIYTGLTGQTDANGATARLWYKQAPTVGASMTFSISNTGKFPGLFVAGFSGSASSPVDQQNGDATVSNVTSTQPGSITPTQDNELVISCVFANISASAPTINSGFAVTDAVAFGSGDHYAGGMAYLVQTSAAAVNPTWSFSVIDDHPCVIASFKAAAAATFNPGWAYSATRIIGGAFQ